MIPTNHRLFVSFSGGKTSAYMARRLRDTHKGPLVFGFANTGCEDERTLVFADKCDREWGLDLVWLEALVHPTPRVGTTHKIVNFETAARNGEPFESVIKKYGIPNQKFPHCTRELKERPIRSYLKSLGWDQVLMAIGIRADEPTRIREGAAEKFRMIYPLASMFPTTKAEINDWWEEQPFQLGMMEHEGNCTWCWKKSFLKLHRIANEHPERFAFPLRMETTYWRDRKGNKQVFFRGSRSALDIMAQAKLTGLVVLPERPDENSGCSESCEAFMGVEDDTADY